MPEHLDAREGVGALPGSTPEREQERGAAGQAERARTHSPGLRRRGADQERDQPDACQVLEVVGDERVEERVHVDEARRYYEETLRRAPAFAAAHNNLANVYLRQGRIEQAIEHYEKALALVPNYQEARQNLNVARTLAGSQQAVQ